MKKILFVALAAVGLTACVQNEELAVNQPSAAIEFANTFVGNASRAESHVINNDNLTGFNVWAFMDEATAPVFTGEEVTLANGVWGYLNTQYWFASHNYYFAALAPIGGNWGVAPATDTEKAKKGLGVVEFFNMNGTEDLLYAEAKVSTPDVVALANGGMDAVNMHFNHLLSKVRFTFVNGFHAGSNIDVEVSEVKMIAPKSGTIDLATDEPKWVLVGEEKTTLDFDEATAADERFVIPAAASQKYDVSFKVVVYQSDRKAMEVTKQAVIEGQALDLGKAYNFTAVIDETTLGLHTIEFTASVEPWATEEEVTVDYYVDKNTGNYVANSAAGLQAIAEGINAGDINSNVDIVLNEDIDLAQATILSRSTNSNWTPIGSEAKPFTGTFDGKGHTIKNLTLVETEAKEGKAYIGFIGYAKDATIKNVKFENVYINIPCLDIDHSQGHIGAVVGSLEGTSTIENVTVKGDIEVEATQTANGASRVAVVAGGNSYGNVTIKNVHVIANEGSYLIANNNTGAIAGQLQGKTVYENCSSNINVTVNKFFAGGIVGLAGTNDKFINCHTTGNIAVVAGREGRANDHYRVGGIAGGWADGKNNVCELIGCTYTGTVSGTNADGSIADPLDYMGYVGRGYTLTDCEGSKVIIDGTEFVQVGNAAPYGNYHVTLADGSEMIADGLFQLGSKYSVTNAEGLARLNTMMANNEAGVGITIELLANIDFAGKTWTPVRSHIDWKSTMNELNGNGHTISNLTVNGQAMFTIFANSHDVVVKDITFDNAKVSSTGINVAIIVGQTYNNLLLENVDVKNSAIVGSYKVAALVGTVYNEGASTITATLKGCDVATTTVKSTGYDFCTAGMVSFVYADDNDKIEFENCSVSDVKLYGPANGYTAHAAIYTTGSESLFNEAEGVTVTNVTFENI